MKYILIKTVKGTNCCHTKEVGEQVWESYPNLNAAHKAAETYNVDFCDCRCEVKEVE